MSKGRSNLWSECGLPNDRKKDDRDKGAGARRRDDMKYMLAVVSAGSKDLIPKHMQATVNPEQDAILAVDIA